ncbi:MAG: haloacid dehalogenase-like hydrolase [Spirochaetales bacterium]|nr:haloacid dehalogenase-like hydrolase [Spirochaetales bacterium]
MTCSRKIIIWDFDGTMYPIAPYDSEQYLLKIARTELPFIKSAAVCLRILLDQKQIFSKHFKKHYISFLTGCNKALIEQTAEYIAGTIPKTEIEHYQELKKCGWKQYIISCGTYDTCISVLAMLGISDCFTEVIANKFIYNKNTISGMTITVNNGEIKPRIMGKILDNRKNPGFNLSHAMAVGDGYTDLPLLKRVGTPILIDWDGKKSSSFNKSGFFHITRPSEVLGIINSVK